jgi:hypothetical protein
MGFDRPRDESEFSKRHAPDLQENPLVDLIGAVFLQIGVNPYWIVAFAKPICKAWPQLVAYASGR